MFCDRDVRSTPGICGRFQHATHEDRTQRRIREEEVRGALLSKRQTTWHFVMPAKRARRRCGQKATPQCSRKISAAENAQRPTSNIQSTQRASLPPWLHD